MSIGTIYILINAAMPNVVKIGKTTKSARERARELSSATGIAMPFMVAYEVAVGDCDLVERLVHEKLAQHRLNQDREFFTIGLREAIQTVTHLASAYPVVSGTASSEDPIYVEITELETLRSRIMLDYYEARRKGEVTLTEDELRDEIDRLSSEYILRKAVEQLPVKK